MKLMNFQWVKLEENNKYFINKYGMILSLAQGHIKLLKHKYDKDGYPYVYVRITELNKRKDLKIHRLVAKYFLSNPNNHTEVNHIDGNKKNCSIDNLEWCSRSENNKHAYNNNLRKPKYKKVMIDGIVYNSQTEASRQLNVNRSTINNWVNKGRGKYID